jgi:hypothetical protein
VLFLKLKYPNLKGLNFETDTVFKAGRNILLPFTQKIFFNISPKKWSWTMLILAIRYW